MAASFIIPTLEALAVQQLAERLAYANDVIEQRNAVISALHQQLAEQRHTVLEHVLQQLNNSNYNLTKVECLKIVQAMRGDK